MKRKKVWVWVAVAAVIGLVSASVGVAGAGVPAASSTKGVTSTTINVAGMVSKPTFASAMQGAQARFDRENANGGVYGRKIKLSSLLEDPKGLQQAKSPVYGERQAVMERATSFSLVASITRTSISTSALGLSTSRSSFTRPGPCGSTWSTSTGRSPASRRISPWCRRSRRSG